MIKHLIRSPFVAATGAAAFVHSTWTLGVLFGGSHPTLSDWQTLISYLLWVTPAALIAFALDVGQVATSIQIAEAHDGGRRPYAKYLTFVIFAAATYYLQWFHLVHHLPALELSPAVGAYPIMTTLKEAAVWFIPALLPLSTLLYTFSSHHKQTEAVPAAPQVEAALESSPPPLPAVSINVPMLETAAPLQNGRSPELSFWTLPETDKETVQSANGHAPRSVPVNGAKPRSRKARGSTDNSAPSDAE